MKGTNDFKFDEGPGVDILLKMANSYKSANINIDSNRYWLNDKSFDFYCGMYAAMRIFASSLINMEEQQKTIDDLQTELSVLSGEISMKALKKIMAVDLDGMRDMKPDAE